MSVSRVLTLKARRSRTPKKNRRIPMIPAGNIDVGPVNVNAVDTRPRRSESGALTAWTGASVTGSTPPFPARRLRWGPVVMVRLWPRPELARVLPRVGLLHEGRDPLTKSCAYCTKAPPNSSTPNPRPVAPHSRAVHPDDDGSHHGDRAYPLQQAEAAPPPPGRPTPPVSQMS